MTPARLLFLFGLTLLLPALARAGLAMPLDLHQSYNEPVGHALQLISEDNQTLTAADALRRFRQTQTTQYDRQVVGLGIGHAPVWVYFRVLNPAPQPEQRHLIIGQSWLDTIDVYLFQQDRLLATARTGDTRPGTPFLNESLGYDIDSQFPPGTTEVLIRVASLDPMLMDIRLLDAAQTARIQQREHYLYGFLYGFIASLAVYNLLLYVGMGRRTSLRYSLYLVSFIVLNMGYTGHLLAWFLRDFPHLNSYLNYALMLLFNITGLHFARQFLELDSLMPRLDQLLRQIFWGLPLLCVLLALFKQQTLVGLVAFSAMALFVFTMTGLGLFAWHRGRKTATYFLLAASISMVGVALTLFSVWGVIPLTPFTFRGLELGIMAEASLLALALADYIRTQQQQRQVAEQEARIDSLTRLHNRRGFQEVAQPAYHVALRHQRPLSLLLIDIDRFKQLNDELGHAAGDLALQALSQLLQNETRRGDSLARWAGEEFLLLLPETSPEEACTLADNLQQAIRKLPLQHQGKPFGFSISVGVSTLEDAMTLDTLIQQAEEALHTAKQHGQSQIRAYPRNQPPTNAQPATHAG